MSRHDELRLADIRDAADKIALLVARGRPALDEDIAVLPALERLIYIISEAASTLSDEAMAQYCTAPWREIKGMRVILAHQYHRVDPNLIWETAATHVPALRRVVA